MHTNQVLQCYVEGINEFYFGFPAEDESVDEEMSEDAEENIPGKSSLKFY